MVFSPIICGSAAAVYKGHTLNILVIGIVDLNMLLDIFFIVNKLNAN